MSKTRKRADGQTDLRTLPADRRPDPTSGQSREPFTLPGEQLNAAERRLLKVLNGKGQGPRETLTVAQLASSSRLTPLEVRNTLRRLVPSAWAERVTEALDDDGQVRAVRGHYRLAAGARLKLARLD